MERMPKPLRKKIDEEMAAFKPFYYGYCRKCVHCGFKNDSLWCYRYGKNAQEIWTCDYFLKDPVDKKPEDRHK